MLSISPQNISTTKHSYAVQEELLEYFSINADNFLVVGKFSKGRS